MLQELIEKLKQQLPGYHFELQIYPSGGIIDAVACDECGTTESASASWNSRGGRRLQTLDDAVEDLRKRLMRPNVS